MVGARLAQPEVALAILAAQERALGVPAVDEDEERRLRGLTPFRGSGWAWEPWLLDGPAGVGYLGLRRPPGSERRALRVDAVGELAPAGRPSGAGTGSTTHGITVAREFADRRLELWLRAATLPEVDAASRLGLVVARTALVMMCRLADVVGVASPPAGVAVRPWRPGDDPGVVAVLASAHPRQGRPWTGDELARRRTADWFRPEDLLVAEDLELGELVGIHWMKRRDPRVGEVHNLALRPHAQGRGVGGALLDAGLAHLAAVGCEEVVLWVDAANEAAVALYASRAFTERCRDVLLRSA